MVSYKKKNKHVDILLGTCISFILTLFLFRGFIFSKGFAWNFGEFGINVGAQDYVSYLWNPLTQQPRVVNSLLIGVWRYMLPLEIGQRLPIILSFTLIGASMFIAIYMLIPDNFGRLERFLSALFGSIFYMVNPFTVTRIPHGRMFFLYALIPLLFYYVYTTLEGLRELEPRHIVTKAIVTSLIIFVMSISIRLPYLAPLIVAILTVQYRTILKNYKKFGLYVVSTSILFVCLSCVWILPTFIPSGSIPSPSSYILTDHVLDLLSRHASVLNVLTFNSHWHNGARELLLFSNSNLNLIRSALLYLIPLFATLPLILFKKNKLVYSLSICALISIFLAKGTNPPISQFYNWLVFNSPLSSFGWMFRGAVKWSFLALTPSFILLSSFSVAWILRKIRDFKLNKHRTAHKFDFPTRSVVTFALFLLVLTIPLFSGAPLLTGDVKGKMSTQNIPTEYMELNNWIDSKDGCKILWYPSIPDWGAKGSSISYNFYLNYVINEGVISKRLDPVYVLSQWGVQYVVVQEDDSNNDGLISILEEKGAKFVKSFGDLKVYELTYASGIVYVDHKVIEATDLTQLAATSQVAEYAARLAFVFPNHLMDEKIRNTDIVFLSGDDLRVPYHVYAMFIAPFEETYRWQPYEVWSKAGTTDPLHGPWHSYLEQREIENWDFDYGKGLVFTWATPRLQENPTPDNSDLTNQWAFDSTADLDQWKKYTRENQFGTLYSLSLENSALKTELWNSTGGWKTINSPLIPAEYSNWFRWELQIKGENAHKVHIKIVEYTEAKEIIAAKQVKSIGSGNFNWQTVTVDFTPENPETKYIQLQIWHGHKTTQPLPNKIWIKNVKVYDLQRFTEPITLEIPFTLSETHQYVFSSRLFQNPQGGEIQIQLDNKNYTLTTKDQLNKFVWKQIDTLNLTKGKHKITLTNLKGFNAVNLFTLIPTQEYQNAQNQLEQTIQNKRTIYILEAETDLYHQNTTTSNKYDGEASNGEVLELTSTSRIWNELEILKPANYTIAIKSKGNLNIKIDQKEYTTNSTNLDWTYLGSIHLEKGKHKIEITPSLMHYHPSDLDVVWLYSTQNKNETLDDIFTSKEVPAEVISYQKIDPTKYVVNVNASNPFMLSFAEAYDPLWIAHVNGEKIEPTPLYSVINGFWINQTGQLEITIEYEPQKWFYIGSAISLTTLTACIAYLIYSYAKSKNLLTKIKQQKPNQT